MPYIKEGLPTRAFFFVTQLSGWPAHGAPAQHVHMQVVDSLTPVLARVDDSSKAFSKTLLRCNFGSYSKQVTQQL